MTVHVFLSYSRRDDKPFGFAKTGWVTRFRRDLEAALQSLPGAEIKVWHDHLLEGNEYFAEAIAGAATTSSILLPILSPAYIEDRNGWLKKELELFVAGTSQTGGLTLQNKSRICPIMRRNVVKKQLPSEIQPINLKHRFYDLDDSTLRDQQYEDQVQSVAQTIHSMMAAMALSAAQAVAKATKVERDPRCIYLAKPTRDLLESFDSLRSELVRLGYKVIPDETFIYGEECRSEELTADIARCSIFVHLLGATLHKLNSSDFELLKVQREIARLQTESGLVQITWVPSYLNLEEIIAEADSEIKDLYTGLSEVTTKGHYLRGNFQKLEEFVIENLLFIKKQIEEEKRRKFLDVLEMPKAYIVCEQSDRKLLGSLKVLFEEQDWIVELPPDTDDLRQYDRLHKEHLRDCQAFIIYYGSADHLWVDHQRIYYRTAHISCETRMPLYSKWIYRGPDQNPKKEQYETSKDYRIDGDFCHPYTKEFVTRVTSCRP